MAVHVVCRESVFTEERVKELKCSATVKKQWVDRLKADSLANPRSLKEVAKFFLWTLEVIGIDQSFLHDTTRVWHSLGSTLEELRHFVAPLSAPREVSVEHLEALIRLLTEKLDLYRFLLLQADEPIAAAGTRVWVRHPPPFYNTHHLQSYRDWFYLSSRHPLRSQRHPASSQRHPASS